MDAIDPSRVRVEPASEIERPLIEGLIQFYIYDFSEMPPTDPDGFAFNDRGGYDPFIDMAEYWSRQGHHPLVIRVDGRAAGFALVNTLSHRGGTVERNMAEFFVARLYRRRGVAAEAVRQILALHPGLWEVAVMERNQAAQVFWPQAIASAAGVSGLRRLEGDGQHWRGPIWTFTVSADNPQQEAKMTGWDGRGLVSTAWLADHLGDTDLRVFDATVHLRPSPSGGPYQIESGRADYEAAHIPGAAFLDLPGELSDTTSPFPFMMPPLDRLASALGSAGIGPELARRRLRRHLADVGDADLVDAARMRFRERRGPGRRPGEVAAEGRAVEAGERRYPPARLSLAPRAGAWADKQAVLAAIDDRGVCTINALSPSVHSGEAPVNYGRKGHIAGSRNVPYASLLNEDGAWRTMTSCAPSSTRWGRSRSPGRSATAAAASRRPWPRSP